MRTTRNFRTRLEKLEKNIGTGSIGYWPTEWLGRGEGQRPIPIAPNWQPFFEAVKAFGQRRTENGDKTHDR